MFVLAGFNIWFTKILRIFFYWIDKIVYGFIPTVYDLLIQIARTSVLSQGDISKMAGRIYELLAIFMVFKVTFSLIMYVVNPDDFSDKSKGVGKLTGNIIISLALLILTPYFFRMAYSLQTIILEDNSLATLVFGKGAENNYLNDAGDDMAFIVFTPFLTPNLGISELYDCSNLYEIDSSGNSVVNTKCTGINTTSFDDLGDDNSLMALTKDDTFSVTTLKNYVAGLNNRSLPLMLRQDIITATDKNNENFIMDYKFLISTVVGVVILLLLVTFCMDVALRSIKLAFLQLIAPIPIISYVDPKSGKDGLFKKWYQMCFKTFASLFIRLLGLYFAVYIISLVADKQLIDIVNGSYITNQFVKIFIIIGALMFAKQLPKILEGLGIKLDGGGKFFLNPIKKFSEEAIGGKQILGFGAAGAAAGLAGATNFASRIAHPNSWRDKNGKFSLGTGLKNVGKSGFSAIGGAASAAWRGSKKAIKGEKMGKVFADSYGEAMYAKLQREDLTRRGSTFFGRRAADFNRITGNLNAGQRQILEMGEQDNEVAGIEHRISSNKVKLTNMKQARFKPLEELQNVSKNIDDLLEADGKVKGAKSAWDAAKTTGDAVLAEQMRQEYKKMKAIRLEQIYKDTTGKEHAHSALKQVVDLHNNLHEELEKKAEYRGITKAISTETEFKYKQIKNGNYTKDEDGNFVPADYGTGDWDKKTSYEESIFGDYIKDEDGNFIEVEKGKGNYKMVEEFVPSTGGNYDYDADGNVIRVADGTGRLIIDNDNSVSGINDMGFNDDSIRDQKTAFESSEEYRDVSDKIEKDQQYLEEFKASAEYIRAHDKNSGALADNAAVGTTAPQKEGWTPNPEHVDAVTYAQGSYGGNTTSFVGTGAPSGVPPRSGGSGRPGGPGGPRH